MQAGRERIEIGLHLELRRRVTNAGVSFGPYIDIHLPFVCVSVGRNPIFAGELDLRASTSRGGLNGDDHPSR